MRAPFDASPHCSTVCFQIDLQLWSSSVDLSVYTPNHAWELESAKSRRNVQVYNCCPEPYIDVVCTFRLRRRAGFFRDLYIIPAILLASLVPFVFALPVTRIHRYILGEELSLILWIVKATGLSLILLIVYEDIINSIQI